MASRTLAFIAIALLALVLAGPTAEAGNLPTGSWTVIANTAVGVLNIVGVGGFGDLTGTIYGDPLAGFWDASRNRITFLRQFGPLLNQTQFYNGFLQSIPPAVAPGLCFHVITGDYFGFSSGATSAANPERSFVAFISAICP